jgi:hypothetical protein
MNRDSVYQVSKSPPPAIPYRFFTEPYSFRIGERLLRRPDTVECAKECSADAVARMDADAEEASGGNNMLLVSAGDSAAVVPVESATSCAVATARPKRHRPPRTAYNATLNQRLRERAKKGEAEALEILQRVRALQRGVPVVAGVGFC